MMLMRIARAMTGANAVSKCAPIPEPACTVVHVLPSNFCSSHFFTRLECPQHSSSIPIPENAVHSETGWRIARALTAHPALAAFPPASPDEILASVEKEDT